MAIALYLPSSLVGEGRDGGKLEVHSPPGSSPTRGEDMKNGVLHSLILNLAPIPAGGAAWRPAVRWRFG